MVSDGVCFGGKGRLHFVDESAKVDSAYYVSRLLPVLSTTALDCCPGARPYLRGGGYGIKPTPTPRNVNKFFFNKYCVNFVICAA